MRRCCGRQRASAYISSVPLSRSHASVARSMMFRSRQLNWQWPGECEPYPLLAFPLFRLSPVLIEIFTIAIGGLSLNELSGVLIAVVSSALGGTAAAITRYLVGSADPITLAILRWGIGVLCVFPTALFLRVRWPQRSDWLAVAALGVCFFGLFFVLYNIAVSYTTAARASLALSTLPLQTMVVGALLGIEPLTKRKTVGVCIAVLVFLLRSHLAFPPLHPELGEAN